jgi:hypothetical protein
VPVDGDHDESPIDELCCLDDQAGSDDAYVAFASILFKSACARNLL